MTFSVSKFYAKFSLHLFVDLKKKVEFSGRCVIVYLKKGGDGSKKLENVWLESTVVGKLPHVRVVLHEFLRYTCSSIGDVFDYFLVYPVPVMRVFGCFYFRFQGKILFVGVKVFM